MVFRHRKPLLIRIFLALACLSLVLSMVPCSPSRPAQAGPAAIPPAFSVSEFEQLWKRTDDPVAQGLATRSWLWGPSPGASLNEAYAQGTGGTRPVQYFDKARMELNAA